MSITPYAFVTATVRLPESTTVVKHNPHQSMAVIPENFAILNGRPRVPMVWCNAEAVVTTNGSYYTERPGITEITDDSIVSFIPMTETWDPVTLTWSPYLDNSYTRYRLVGTQGSAPYLDSIEYVIGREIFNSPAMIVSPALPLVSNFNEGSDDSTDFTFAIAFNPRELDEDEPLVTFGDTSTITLTETGVEVVFEEYSFNVKVPYKLTDYTPVYLVFDLDSDEATLTVALSPTKLSKGSSPITERTVDFDFVIAGEVDIFAIDLWGDDAPPPVDIISRYSSVLGAH